MQNSENVTQRVIERFRGMYEFTVGLP